MALPVIQGEQVTLRPLAEADLEPLAEIIREPSVARWWGESDEPERLRENLRMDGDAWAIELDGELIGWLGFVEESEPEYRSVAFDISLSERGHHRFTIDPNAGNERAIKAYSAVGFKPVGITRRAELVDGEWTDGLMMDLLIEELT